MVCQNEAAIVLVLCQCFLVPGLFSSALQRLGSSIFQHRNALVIESTHGKAASPLGPESSPSLFATTRSAPPSSHLPTCSTSRVPDQRSSSSATNRNLSSIQAQVEASYSQPFFFRQLRDNYVPWRPMITTTANDSRSTPHHTITSSLLPSLQHSFTAVDARSRLPVCILGACAVIFSSSCLLRRFRESACALSRNVSLRYSLRRPRISHELGTEPRCQLERYVATGPLPARYSLLWPVYPRSAAI
ncbi:hypothetical protein EDB81DRAFT_308469 [Dactylonectria macrodidyma]|uniref:Uncharacterized protein n=1 Tax=Dactylonectria macrodidyma TaxID=307937 RepID=A0A9P9IA32_9HYPO|nr:hypothetical protein EDB81DRAFT_308469 [Dactylonectria macrodidyma]